MYRFITFLTLLVTFAAVVDSRPATAAAPVVWNADLIHSRAEFTVSHMVVSKVWGHIPILALTLVTQPGSVVPTKIETTLNVAREDTDNQIRDQDLRSQNYFDIAQYPTMTFKSTSIKPIDKDNFQVNGDLTVKNITKAVSFPAHIEGRVPDPAGVRVGYSGQLRVDRRDFGITDQRMMSGVLFVGYDVTIGLTVEATTSDPSIKPQAM